MNGRPGEQVFLTAHRPMRALLFDPAPGSVAGVRALASRLRGLGDDLSGVRGHLEHPGLDVWSGPTAARVVRHLEDLVARTDVLTTSVDEAASALLTWAGRLQDLQDRADALDREAVAAAAAGLDAEQAVAAAAYRSVPLPPDPAQRRALSDALSDARADLDAVHARAQALGQEYAQAAAVHAALLDDAGTGLVPAALQGVLAAWDLAKDVEAALVRPVAGHVDTFADATSAAASAADVAAIASAASGPGAAVVAPVAEAASIALALATTRARLTLASGAGGSWTEAGVEAVSVAGGVFTRVPGKVAIAAARSDVVDVDELDVRTAAMALLEGGPDGGTWTVERHDQAGVAFPLQAHAVADPWEVGQGFAAAAVVRATVPQRATGTGPAAPAATPAAARRPESSSAAANRPQAPG